MTASWCANACEGQRSNTLDVNCYCIPVPAAGKSAKRTSGSKTRKSGSRKRTAFAYQTPSHRDHEPVLRRRRRCASTEAGPMLYSYRKVASGSTRVARSAGMRLAVSAMNKRKAAAITNAIGSSALIPNRTPDKIRDTAAQARMPIAAPARTGRIARRNTIATTSPAITSPICLRSWECGGCTGDRLRPDRRVQGLNGGRRFPIQLIGSDRESQSGPMLIRP